MKIEFMNLVFPAVLVLLVLTQSVGAQVEPVSAALPDSAIEAEFHLEETLWTTFEPVSAGVFKEDPGKKTATERANYLPLTEIARMARHGAPEALVISEIQRSGSAYQLNSENTLYLKRNDVSQRIIDYMLSTGF